MHWNKATLAMEAPAKELIHFSEPCSFSIIYTNRKTPLVQTALPNASWLRQCDYNYSASYLTTYKGVNSQFQTADLIQAFIKATPFWFKLLIGARKKDAPFIGYGLLKNMFHIIHESSNEVVFEVRQQNSRYKFSLLRSQFRRAVVLKNLFLSTTVAYNNSFGECYFTIIKPLYEYALKRTLKQLVPYLEA